MRVQLYLKDFTSKVHSAKTHLKEVLALLNELTFDLIERVLNGQVMVLAQAHPFPPADHVADAVTIPTTRRPRPPSSIRFICDTCSFVCASAGALGSHKRCKHPSL